jgi:DNA repair exonuclease SbcCD ATPase subunit/DNA repair exonuclease SbcCD nuclease subunit
MRIVHIADVHWRGLSRHDEYRKAFTDFFSQCKELKPDIIYIGGDIVHSKTQGISPELIDNLSWWFTSMAEIAPTHIILGNHDGLILNKDRQDAITPIITMLDNDNLFLYKKSGTYPIGIPGFNWCVLSCFDEENYSKAIPVPGEINIALYHGAVRGSLTDTDWQLDGEININSFENYEFTMLGDIHKQQFLNEKKTIAYCGSTIQQNYGESGEKGFLLWDIRSPDDFDVEFYPVKHDNPFITVSWQGSVESTIIKCKNYPTGVRFRIRTDQSATHVECRRLQKELVKYHKAKEVVFKSESTFDPRKVMVENATLSQQNLRDPGTHRKMFREFYKDSQIDVKTWEKVDSMIDLYVDKLTGQDETLRNIQWEINKIEFDNLFSYGEGNSINFDNLPGITGIFGTNARGKSSIIGSIVYTLFNSTDRGSIKNLHIINTRKNMCKASIWLTISGQRYRIDRKSIKKNAKAGVWAPTSLSFYRVDKDNNVLDDLTEEQRRETEKIIRGLIGNSDDFLLTSLASQGEMNNFIKEKASSRKQILTNFLDLEVFDKLHDAVKKDAQEVKIRFKAIGENNWVERISDTQNLIISNDLSLKEINKDITMLKDNIDKLKDEMRSDTIVVLESDVKKAYDRLIKTEQRISEDDEEISNIKIKIRAKQKKLKILNEFLNGDILEEMKERRSAQINLELSIKEMKYKIDLIKRDIKQSKQSIKILEDVPCGDKFPTCKFIKNSHKSKKSLISQEANLISLNTNLTDLRQLYYKVKDKELEDKINKYEQMVQKKSNLTTETSKSNLYLAKLEENMKWHIKDLKKFQAEYERLEAVFNNQDDADDNSELIKLCDLKIKDLKNYEVRKIKVINKLAELKAKISALKRDRKIYEELKERNRCYDIFSNAVSKKGIPLHIINKMLPAINVEISKILTGVVGFTVDIESDLDTNSLDVYINYGDSRRIIELASGMEKMMASLAIRVALINVSSLSKTTTLMIDEGFGALDATNLESCNRLLISLKKWFKNILVISHVDAIKDCVDHNLEILKKGKDSYVFNS